MREGKGRPDPRPSATRRPYPGSVILEVCLPLTSPEPSTSVSAFDVLNARQASLRRLEQNLGSQCVTCRAPPSTFQFLLNPSCLLVDILPLFTVS